VTRDLGQLAQKSATAAAHVDHAAGAELAQQRDDRVAALRCQRHLALGLLGDDGSSSASSSSASSTPSASASRASALCTYFSR